MDRNPRIGLVFSDEDEFDDDGVQCASLLGKSRFHAEIVSGATIEQPFQKLLAENFIPTSTVMVRRQCFETVGLFDVTLKGPEDRDMWSRLAASFDIACVPRMLGRKRIVASSVSRDLEATLRSRVRLWTKAGRCSLISRRSERSMRCLRPPTSNSALSCLEKVRRATREAGLNGLRTARQPYYWLLGVRLVVSSVARGLVESVFDQKRRLPKAKSSI